MYDLTSFFFLFFTGPLSSTLEDFSFSFLSMFFASLSCLPLLIFFFSFCTTFVSVGMLGWCEYTSDNTLPSPFVFSFWFLQSSLKFLSFLSLVCLFSCSCSHLFLVFCPLRASNLLCLLQWQSSSIPPAVAPARG
eukprot:m.85587 g.85587  ORF g.85587 m.85587 type:complete len:135 (-) comp14431_c0_seq1:74-478(-)